MINFKKYMIDIICINHGHLYQKKLKIFYLNILEYLVEIK